MMFNDDNSNKIDKESTTENFAQKSLDTSILLKKTFLNYLFILFTIIALFLSVNFIAIPTISGLFEITSPWSQQRKEISEMNSVRDIYSTIIGSESTIIHNNGLVQWFSSKEAKEIIISIPKLINYSPIFNDDTYRNDLKDTFINSINKDTMRKSTDNYLILYDGATITEFKKGKESTYKDLSENDRESIEKDLIKYLHNRQKPLNFDSWEKIPKTKEDNVDFTYDYNSNIVKVTGKFIVKDKIIFTKKYSITVKYEKNDGKWQLNKESVRLTEK
ncbi:hypothetical protein [Streptococcus zalophi]|uniref:hypothetical protein n=1 Tax=Streptococcus zalophi TaxID=640031 RepID=UPI00215BE3AF|nr:hypothetical protein [Streptococcus zalophi]MCR8967545.1 hypothetical protein [Streptococcus zalophi]